MTDIRKLYNIDGFKWREFSANDLSSKSIIINVRGNQSASSRRNLESSQQVISLDSFVQGIADSVGNSINVNVGLSKEIPIVNPAGGNFIYDAAFNYNTTGNVLTVDNITIGNILIVSSLTAGRALVSGGGSQVSASTVTTGLLQGFDARITANAGAVAALDLDDVTGVGGVTTNSISIGDLAITNVASGVITTISDGSSAQWKQTYDEYVVSGILNTLSLEFTSRDASAAFAVDISGIKDEILLEDVVLAETATPNYATSTKDIIITTGDNSGNFSTRGVNNNANTIIGSFGAAALNTLPMMLIEGQIGATTANGNLILQARTASALTDYLKIFGTSGYVEIYDSAGALVFGVNDAVDSKKILIGDYDISGDASGALAGYVLTIDGASGSATWAAQSVTGGVNLVALSGELPYMNAVPDNLAYKSTLSFNAATDTLSVDNLIANVNIGTTGQFALVTNASGDVIESTVTTAVLQGLEAAIAAIDEATVTNAGDERLIVQTAVSGQYNAYGELKFFDADKRLMINGILDVDNLRIDGNILSSTNTNGNINLTPNGSGGTFINSTLEISGITNVAQIDAYSTGNLTFKSNTGQSIRFIDAGNTLQAEFVNNTGNWDFKENDLLSIGNIGPLSGSISFDLNAGTIVIPSNPTGDVTGKVRYTGGTNFEIWDGVWNALGGGDVSISGVPIANQIAVWATPAAIKGEADFTFDGTDVRLFQGTLIVSQDNTGTKGSVTIDPTTSSGIVFKHQDVAAADTAIISITNVTDTGSVPVMKLNIGDANIVTRPLYVIQNNGTTVWQVNANGSQVFNNQVLSNILDPVSAQDAATKAYTDAVSFTLQQVVDSSSALTTAILSTANVNTFGSTTFSSDISFVAAAGTITLPAAPTITATGALRYDNGGGGLLEVYDGGWSPVGGLGDVIKVGVPIVNQIGVWTGDGTIEGEIGFTYSGGAFTASTFSTGTAFTQGSGSGSGSILFSANNKYMAKVTPGQDVGTIPAHQSVSFLSTGAGLTTRPLFGWYNYQTKVTEVDVNGNWNFQDNEIQDFALQSYTVAGVPSASVAGKMIYVSDESGGAIIAFSDGTNWRRMTDRVIVS